MLGEKPKPRPVKLVCGVLFAPTLELPTVDSHLISQFGPIDLKSPVFDFTYTEYYNTEMGLDLKKQFYSFEKLIMPDELSDIKKQSRDIELKFSKDDKRSVNLDPGYLEESKFVLASTKNFSHRIYLRDNIWAEVTMRFAHGQFIKHDWTYPDWSSELGIEFLKKAREIYRGQLELL
jgi:hypothetical protein